MHDDIKPPSDQDSHFRTRELDHEKLLAAAAAITSGKDTSEVKTFREKRKLMQNWDEECSRIPEDEEATIDLPGAHAVSAFGDYVPRHG